MTGDRQACPKCGAYGGNGRIYRQDDTWDSCPACTLVTDDREPFREARGFGLAKRHETRLARAEAMVMSAICASVQQDNPCSLHVCGNTPDHPDNHRCLDCGMTWERT